MKDQRSCLKADAISIKQGFPKGARLHLAHDFAPAKSSVLCLPADCCENVY